MHDHIDLVGPLPVSNDHRYLLTIVDRFSRWFEAIPLKDITAKTYADPFILHFVARYDSLQTITADRGRQFCSNFWKDLTKFLRCELIHTTSYNPKANGFVERCHRVLKAGFKTQTHPNDWYSNLGWILLEIRFSIRNDVDFSPAEMIYGTIIRLPGEYFFPSIERPIFVEYVHQLQKFVRDLRPVPTRKIASRLIHVL